MFVLFVDSEEFTMRFLCRAFEELGVSGYQLHRSVVSITGFALNPFIMPEVLLYSKRL
jgi:hypothetical protein